MSIELSLSSVDKQGVNDFVLSMAPIPVLILSELTTKRKFMKWHVFLYSIPSAGLTHFQYS